jgi:hypothetical protein
MTFWPILTYGLVAYTAHATRGLRSIAKALVGHFWPTSPTNCLDGLIGAAAHDGLSLLLGLSA